MKKFLYDLFDILKTIIVVLIIAFIVRYFLFQPFLVEGHSMDPNFADQEYLLVNKLSYRFSNPKRGDVVVFRAPNNPNFDYIKRIVGLPGEFVQIKDNQIYINGKELAENYLGQNTETIIKNDNAIGLEVQLKNDQYFVLGDNREHSSDSRDWGVLPNENIVGKAWLSLYPVNYAGFIPGPSY